MQRFMSRKRKKISTSISASQKSARQLRLRSSLSSSIHTEAPICTFLGNIPREEDYTDDTLLAYLQFFKEPMPLANVATLVELGGLSSPAQLCLPDEQL
ncbi:hypothetical protein D1007_04538 [Hordeum vulgare]|nr:hypothetical protein D1007_04538 [Hordeum vulgare]